jgi:hypothetical protein
VFVTRKDLEDDVELWTWFRRSRETGLRSIILWQVQISDIHANTAKIQRTRIKLWLQDELNPKAYFNNNISLLAFWKFGSHDVDPSHPVQTTPDSEFQSNSGPDPSFLHTTGLLKDCQFHNAASPVEVLN